MRCFKYFCDLFVTRMVRLRLKGILVLDILTNMCYAEKHRRVILDTSKKLRMLRSENEKKSPSISYIFLNIIDLVIHKSEDREYWIRTERWGGGMGQVRGRGYLKVIFFEASQCT